MSIMLCERHARRRGLAAAAARAEGAGVRVVWKTDYRETCNMHMRMCMLHAHVQHVFTLSFDTHKQNLLDHSVSAGHTSLGHSHAKFSSARVCSRSPH